MATEEELAGVNYVIGEVRRLYPNLAWMIDVPELANVIMLAGAEQWDEGRIIAAIQNTEWWKQRNETARAYEQLIHTDPASATQQKGQYAQQLIAWARSNGLNLTDQEATFVAGVALGNGETLQETQANLLRTRYSEMVGTSGATPVGDQLQATAAQYGVPIADLTLLDWQRQILGGQVDQATFEAYIKEQAKSLYPGLANAIDRGVSVAQYTAPYWQIAAQELGINPAEIDLRDAKWNAAINKIDPKTGAPVAMSLSEWTKALRTDTAYGFDQTQGAVEQATALGQGLLEKLGRAA